MALKLAQKLHDVVQAINLNGNGAVPPNQPWPYRMAVVQLEGGGRVAVDIASDSSLSVVPADAMVSRMLTWNKLHPSDERLLTPKDAFEAYRLYLASNEAISAEEIAAALWKSEPGYTWRRLPWDPMNGGTPTWDEMLSRMSNREAFMAFIGGLMVPEARQHQYLWLHGQGGDGKGAINRFLTRILGHSYRSKQPPERNGSRFWTYGLIGATVVVFPDCNAAGFVASGLFKSLTGGDPIEVEAKNLMSFTTRLHAKYVFLSNEKPNISSEIADLRRIIYCEFERRGDEHEDDPDFERKLWDEGGFFLTKCLAMHRHLAPDHRRIPATTEEILSIVSAHEEEFEVLFLKHFKQPHPKYRTADGVKGLTDEQKRLVTLAPDDLLAVLKLKLGGDTRVHKAFREWLVRRFGVARRSLWIGGMGTYRYVGICLSTGRQVRPDHLALVGDGGAEETSYEDSKANELET